MRVHNEVFNRGYIVDMTDRPTFEYQGKPVRAAGILVWTRKDDQVHRLFRRIQKKYEDIGGKTDLIDQSPLDTAIRETVEETHVILRNRHARKLCGQVAPALTQHRQ